MVYFESIERPRLNSPSAEHWFPGQKKRTPDFAEPGSSASFAWWAQFSDGSALSLQRDEGECKAVQRNVFKYAGVGGSVVWAGGGPDGCGDLLLPASAAEATRQ